MAGPEDSTRPTNLRLRAKLALGYAAISHSVLCNSWTACSNWARVPNYFMSSTGVPIVSNGGTWRMRGSSRLMTPWSWYFCSSASSTARA